MRCFQLVAWEYGKSSVHTKACLYYSYHMLGWEFLQPMLNTPELSPANKGGLEAASNKCVCAGMCGSTSLM